jgi:outer membrane protein assembly factor BamC
MWQRAAVFLALVAGVGMGLSGCGYFGGEKGVVKDRLAAKYKQASSLPPLEVPPDLTSSTIDDLMVVPDISPSGTATYSAYAGERDTVVASERRTAVLPEAKAIRIERDGNIRWLVIQSEPTEVWARVREFWQEGGFTLKRDDPRIGIMETEWAENRAEIPEGTIRRVLGKVLDPLYSASTRDKFRVRLERSEEPAVTELYLTHFGVEEVTRGETILWQPRPPSPELEAEMLNRLLVFLGADEKRAEKTMAAGGPSTGAKRGVLQREAGGASVLVLTDEFAQAWRRTGLALDRIGFTVEDRDRSRGEYRVRYQDSLAEQDKPGMLSRLAFWRKGSGPSENARYIIEVSTEGAGTKVSVLDNRGRRDTSDTARQILSLLQEQLN